MINVLIIDDSAFMRRAITKMLGTDPALHVIDTARDGQDGLEKIKKHRPDVVTMDVEMPLMDGLTLLKALRREAPDPRPAVLMCSSLTGQGSHTALQALTLGATDVILKDPAVVGAGNAEFQRELISKIKGIGQARAAKLGRSAPAAPTPRATPAELRDRQFELVLIGSSTGGPPVLETLLRALPGNTPFPVVVAQHMPALFTKSLAERLNGMCNIDVVHCDAEARLRPGAAHIIVGGKHGRVKKGQGGLVLEVSEEPREALYKPAVNELLASGAGVGPRCLGVVVTGMGDDGMLGARELTRAGGMVVAQDAATSVVYGMPRAVIDDGSACAAMTPTELGQFLASLATRSQARAA